MKNLTFLLLPVVLLLINACKDCPECPESPTGGHAEPHVDHMPDCIERNINEEDLINCPNLTTHEIKCVAHESDTLYIFTKDTSTADAWYCIYNYHIYAGSYGLEEDLIGKFLIKESNLNKDNGLPKAIVLNGKHGCYTVGRNETLMYDTFNNETFLWMEMHVHHPINTVFVPQYYKVNDSVRTSIENLKTYADTNGYEFGIGVDIAPARTLPDSTRVNVYDNIDVIVKWKL